MIAKHLFKPTILIVGPLPPPYGGIATAVSNFLKSDLQKYFKLICIKNSTNRPSVKKGKIDFLNVAYFLGQIFRFIIIIIFVRPRIVQIEATYGISFLKNSLFVILSKILGRKIILSIYGGQADNFYNNLPPIGKKYVKFILLCCHKIKVEFKRGKKFFVEKFGLPESKIFILPNAVYLNKIPDENVKPTEKELNLLFVGWILKEKGIFDLLKGIEILKQKGYKFKVKIVGPEGKEGELKKVLDEIQKRNLIDIVEVTGKKSSYELQNFYSDADIFILPSYAEGLPYVILEAMSYKLPIVSTRVGALPEVIEEGANGFLVEPGNIKALTEKIEILAKNKNLREEIGRNNYEKIKNEYSMDHLVKKLANIYNILLLK